MAKQCWSQTVLESGSWGHSVLQTPALVHIYPENRSWHFMQIVSIGDSLHEMSQPVFWGGEKKKNISISSGESSSFSAKH